MRKYALLLVICLLSLSAVLAQPVPEPRSSPLDMARMRYRDTYVKITYSQPYKRGRTIFGELVPYGKVWRTGANEAAELTCTGDIYINGVLLHAGTYSVFTIPDKIKWTIIINRDVGLWGDYNYNPKLDVMRVDVAVQEADPMNEAFSMKFDQNNDRASWIMTWDDIMVAIPIRFGTTN